MRRAPETLPIAALDFGPRLRGPWAAARSSAAMGMSRRRQHERTQLCGVWWVVLAAPKSRQSAHAPRVRGGCAGVRVLRRSAPRV